MNKRVAKRRAEKGRERQRDHGGRHGIEKLTCTADSNGTAARKNEASLILDCGGMRCE